MLLLFALVSCAPCSHLALDLLSQSLELIHLKLLLWPADAQSLRLVGLGDLFTNNQYVRNTTTLVGICCILTMWTWTYQTRRSVVPLASITKDSGRAFQKTHVANFLVGKLAVVLQDVVILGASGNGNLLRDGLRGNYCEHTFIGRAGFSRRK